MIHYVYSTRNLVNGMWYIGKRSERVLSDRYLGSGTEFSKDKRKYGRSSFERTIISFHETSEEAYQAEAELVTQDVVDEPMSYNGCLGGHGAQAGHRHSEDTKRKIRTSNVGKKHAKWSEETKREHSLRFKGKSWSENQRKGMSGIKRSPETRARIASSRIGKSRSESDRQAMRDGWAKRRHHV